MKNEYLIYIILSVGFRINYLWFVYYRTTNWTSTSVFKVVTL